MPKGIYKNPIERGIKISKGLKGNKNGFKKGRTPWNKGKKLSLEIRKKLSESHKGQVPSFYKGSKHSEETKLKLSGINSPNWKGGLTKNIIYRKQYSKNYEEKRKKKKEKLAGRKKPEQCEVCGAFGQICFDHDHITGKFRGWICWRCNVVLGHIKDSKDLLNKLIDYLK